MLAIIGGSGFTQWAKLEDARSIRATTPYGAPSDNIMVGKLAGTPCMFLARHGLSHSIAPHDINYRANIWALRDLGASWVLSVATVGGISPAYVPGALSAPHQIIDYTWGRRHTFFDESAAVTHVDFTQPYSESKRTNILSAARAVGEAVLDRAIYAVTQGPRLETAAEIDRFARDGADIVGMTAMPEAALAREAGLDYAAIAVVANHAAGRGDSRTQIDLEAIHAVHAQAMARVAKIITSLARSNP